MAAAIVAAVDRQTANTGGAHLSEGELLAGRSPHQHPHQRARRLDDIRSRARNPVRGARRIAAASPARSARLHRREDRHVGTHPAACGRAEVRGLVEPCAHPGDRGLDQGGDGHRHECRGRQSVLLCHCDALVGLYRPDAKFPTPRPY